MAPLCRHRHRPVRVVSLVPSVTETLLEWGTDVVACTRFCEQPGLRHVGGTKDPDVAAIVSLAPDLVVLDREENRREDADALAAGGLRCHATHVRSLDDVEPTLQELAEAVAADPPPVGWLAPPPPSPQRAPAFVPIWRRPWMTISGDTYGSTLLAAIGIDNVFAGCAERYPTVDLAAVAGLAPRLVLLPSEPYPFSERHVAEIAAALPSAEVHFLDGRDLFWWGVRTPGALRRLAAQLGSSASP